ncbi:M48 family metalloprotease [Mycobacterium sp. GA-1199]|uniref:M48 family metalloprotease n=1 Tax=Mycobacterium sp. GA-1199 TaxID=1772287 RepID=UPI000B2733C5|nr:M48 family metalloprotease [Mycobacterium sp. GA-1199]
MLIGMMLSAGFWGASALLLLRTEVPALDLRKPSPSSYFSASELDQIQEFGSVARWFWIASTLAGLGVLALLTWRRHLLASKVSRMLRLAPNAVIRRGAAVAACCSLAVWLAILPIGVAEHWWSRRFGLRAQDYGAWLVDRTLAGLLMTAVVSLAVTGAVYLAIRFGRHWWMAGTPVIALIGVLVVIAQPLLIDPLFNRYSSVGDRNLSAQIETLADRLGVSITSVDVSDASRRSTTANAKVTGIGPTRHVVLYDTLLDGRFTHSEIVWVSAHELAHAARGHVWKRGAWFALFAIPALSAIAWVTERRGGLRDPAVVPLAVLCASALLILLQPAQNAISRHYEAEADWLALRTTGDVASAIGTQRGFALSGLIDPDPPTWALIIRGTHPTAMQRIAMAEAQRP